MIIRIDFKNEDLISPEVKSNKLTFKEAEPEFPIKNQKDLDDHISDKILNMKVAKTVAAMDKLDNIAASARVSGGSSRRIHRKTRKTIRKSRRNLRKSPKSIRRYRR